MPELSVVIPTYNRASLLRESILSVLNQTFPNFELIVVDDGSTDNTEEVVSKFNDSRIKYISYQTNRGAPYARNIGWRKSSTDYVMFHDSDDLMLPEKIEIEMETMKNSDDETGVVYSRFYWVELGKLYPPEHPLQQMNGWIEEDMAVFNHVNTHVLVKKWVLERTEGFDEQFESCQEWDFLIRAARECKFQFTGELLFLLKKRDDSLSKSSQKLQQGKEKMLEKHGTFIDKFLAEKKTQLEFFLKKETVGKDLFIWGTGEAGKMAYGFMKERNIDVRGFIDSSIEKQGETIEGKNVFSPQEISAMEVPLKIFIETGAAEHISNQMKAEGLLKEEQYSCNLIRGIQFSSAQKLKLIEK